MAYRYYCPDDRLLANCYCFSPTICCCVSSSQDANAWQCASCMDPAGSAGHILCSFQHSTLHGGWSHNSGKWRDWNGWLMASLWSCLPSLVQPVIPCCGLYYSRCLADFLHSSSGPTTQKIKNESDNWENSTIRNNNNRRGLSSSNCDQCSCSFREIQKLHLKKENNITLSLIVVDIVFLICQPIHPIRSFCEFLLPAEKKVCGTPYSYYESLTATGYFINSSVNFVIFCLCSKGFRRKLFQKLCHERKRKVQGAGSDKT